MTLPPLGLYIHLPWCERKCPYCDFNSHAAGALPEARYIDSLLADLQTDAPLRQGRAVDTIFIGGGTPSLFSVAGLERLLREVAATLPVTPGAEVTLEANPGSAEAEKFEGFSRAGVTRLSLGIQSFDDTCLAALGRVHNADQAHAAVEFAKSAGFDSFNIDLMHGLPGQTPDMAGADLRAAVAHAPAHLSWYQLTIEPNTTFYTRPPTLPLEDDLADIQARGEQQLADAGYVQYEVSAYSKPGRQCRHNRNYWAFGDYLGIGAGAHGKITFADGRVERRAKTRQPGDYMSAAARTANTRVLGPGDLVGEYMLNALRLNAGFSTGEFAQRTGLAPGVLDARLGELCERGLLQRKGEQVAATAVGRRFLDTVIAEFFD